MKPLSLPTPELVKMLGITSQRIAALVSQLDISDTETFRQGKRRFYTACAVKKILQHRGFDYAQKIITFTTLKGGTGKTTLSLATAGKLAYIGAKILFIDLDKQANATITLHGEAVKHVFIDLIQNNCSVEDAVVKVNDNLDLIPSSLANSRLEAELSSQKVNQRAYYKKLLAPIINNYDYIIIDTPPDLSNSVYLAMLASDILIIPVGLDRYSIEGLHMTLNTINEMRASYLDLKIDIKVVVNKYDDRESTINFDYLNHLKEFQAIVMPKVIRVDASFRKMQKATIFPEFLSKSSKASDNIREFTQSLIGY